MVSAPKKRGGRLTRPATKLIIRYGPEDGSAPTDEDETELLQNPIITRRAGGRGLDECQLTYSLSKAEQRLVDAKIPTGYARQVEVIQKMPSGASLLLFFGDLASQRLRVAPDGEGVSVVARLDAKVHFGRPLLGTINRRLDDEDEAEAVIHHVPIVLNPEIDGIIQGNKSDKGIFAYTGPDGEIGYNAWLDFESQRTDKSSGSHDSAVRQKWNLRDAIFTVCWYCNADRDYFENPRSEELIELFEEDNPEPENLTLTTGAYLPQLLDELLEPHGYSWRTNLSFSELGGRVAKIQIFKLGAGTERDLRLQRPPAALDLDQSNTPEADIDASVLDLANVVHGFGGLIEREIGITLYRGWPASEDNIRPDELARNDGAEFAAHPNAWRLWVANEGGDWSNLRTSDEVGPIPNSARDLSAVLGADTLPRRRKLFDALTQIDEPAEPGETPSRRRREALVQFLDTYEGTDSGGITEITAADPTVIESEAHGLVSETLIVISGSDCVPSIDGTWAVTVTDADHFTLPIEVTEAGLVGEWIGGNWSDVPDGWGAQILPDQIGVYFSGNEIPEELVEFGDRAAIRVIGTIQGDTRLTATAERAESSPSAREIAITLDLSDRFYDRQRHESPPFASNWEGDEPADERDDAEALAAYVERVRLIQDAAPVSGNFRLFGIQQEYEIGDLIRTVKGRELSMNRLSPDAETKRYPQVMEIVRDYAAQSTRLIASPTNEVYG